MNQPLDFEAARDTGSNSWERADPTTALIEPRSPHAWTVTLPDGNDVHRVVVINDGGTYIGSCTCDGFQFHDSPCAHLCTIRKADVVGDPDIYGNSIHIERVDRDEADDLADHYDTERARADGGQEVRR